MVLENQPAIAQMVDKSGNIKPAWNEWFTKLTAVLNNTETKTFVVSVSPTVTDDITYIKGE